MKLGLQKGDKVSLLSEGRNLWPITEMGILYAGGVNVPLSIKLEESNDLIFRIRHSDSKYVIVSASQLPKVRKIIGDCEAVEKVIVLDEIRNTARMKCVSLRYRKWATSSLPLHQRSS